MYTTNTNFRAVCEREPRVICNPCQEGGNMNEYKREDLAHERHKACEYADCVCQHKVGNWVIKKPPRTNDA